MSAFTDIIDKPMEIAKYYTPAERENFSYHTDEELLELLAYFDYDGLAASTWYNKYAAREFREITPADMHRRLAIEFGKIEDKFNKVEISHMKGTKEKVQVKLTELENSLSEYGYKRELLDERRIFYLFDKFRYIIPQGSVMSQAGTSQIGSLSNCFVTESPHDSYGGVLRTDQHLAQIYKRRGGAGVDISTLRPSGSPTSNVAKTSTGAASFMERFSNTTREVAQGGRRGALMISMDINHPDIQEFIDMKRDLTKVTGANVSVRISDKFMEAVNKDEMYPLHWPKGLLDGREYKDFINHGFDNELIAYKDGYVKVVSAKKVWDQLIAAAHGSGEPGILFWDKVLNYGTDGVYPDLVPISTNPCGEIPIPANDSCRLIAMNLLSFIEEQYTTSAYFNYDKFYQYVYEAMRLNDDLVELELEAVQRIIDKIEADDEPADVKATELDLWKEIKQVGGDSRRTGLGFTALGDAGAALGLDYGSKLFFEFVEEMMKTKLRAELDCSIDLAITRGPFPKYDFSNEFTVIDGKYYGYNNFYQMLADEFPEQVARMADFGRRNISVSTVAPTGSLSMLAQVSSGMEPMFQFGYTRRRKINADQIGIIESNHVDAKGDHWSEHNVVHQELKNWIELEWDLGDVTVDELSIEEIREAFEQSPWSRSSANDIDWVKRVEIQSLIQKYTTHSISSTINLPRSATIEDVDIIYRKGWEHNLKGVTVYRDGCRDGVLVSLQDKKKTTQKFSYIDSVKRPNPVRAESHTTQVAGEKYSVFVGLVDGLPYEVFAYKGGTKEGNGYIEKIDKGEYYFLGDGEESRHRILTGKMTDEQEVITRFISGSLRHGRDIKFIVDDLQKTSGSLFAFNNAIARILKGYIPNGTQSAAKCQNPDCSGDGTNVIYEEGCHKCLDCGSGACG